MLISFSSVVLYGIVCTMMYIKYTCEYALSLIHMILFDIATGIIWTIAVDIKCALAVWSNTSSW